MTRVKVPRITIFLKVCLLLTTGYWLLISGHWLLATGHSLDTPITFSGNSYFSTSKIWELTGHRPNESFDIDELEAFLKEILDLYLSRGFLFASVQVADTQYPTPDTPLTIQITESKIVRADQIVFSGNKTTKDAILLTESRIQKGQVITPQIIATAQRRIESKPYIEACQIVPMNENTLLINITEGKMTHLSGILGYSNNKDQKNKFTGLININLLNLFGTDRNLGFAWRGLANDFNSTKLTYHESGPINLNLAADLLLYREEQDSTYIKTELGLDIYYHFLTQKLGGTVGRADLYAGSRKDDQKPARQADTKLGFFWEGDFTDDIINPRTGWEVNFRQSVVFVERETPPPSERGLYAPPPPSERGGVGGGLSNSDHRAPTTEKGGNFQRLLTELSIANYLPISKSFVLSNRITGKFLENKNLTSFDMLKLGGTFTLRGFFEDFYTGNNLFYTNTELRYLLTKTSRVFIFVDYGYIENDLENKRLDDLFGMGFGLRADTAIGVLRLDYGFHHHKKWLHPMDGIVHFGLEARF